ncbi:MAG: relaxase/mobilization nuclease domain-containing protein [Chitinophagaceae bacterium]
MFIRKKPNKSGVISVQIIDKSRGRYRVLKTRGSSGDENTLTHLMEQARKELRLMQRQQEFNFDNNREKQLLDYLGVRGYDYKLMAEDFIAQSELRPSKQKACFHAALSFYPGEKPSDETMIQIAREYLEELGIVNTQYPIVKHTDKAHLHLNILANRVDNDGKPIKDGWIGLRGKKVAQQLTRKYKTHPG